MAPEDVPAGRPLVTVVIPCFDAGRFVLDAVASVLGQTYPAIECLVVDDGSAGSTVEVLASIDDPRVRVIRQPRLGVSAARNRGAQEASGPLLAFLDADDVWFPSKLEEQVAVLEGSPGVGAVMTAYAVTDEQLRPSWLVRCPSPEARLRTWLLMEGEGPALPSTVLLRTEVFRSLGGFDGRFPPSEDLHFGVRMARQTGVVSLDHPLVLYRRHSAQSSRDLSRLEGHMLEIFDLLLGDPADAALRRRAQGNLQVRLLAHHLRHRRWGSAAVALAAALRVRPTALAVLPARVVVRRARRRLAGRPRVAPIAPKQGDPHVVQVTPAGEKRESARNA